MLALSADRGGRFGGSWDLKLENTRGQPSLRAFVPQIARLTACRDATLLRGDHFPGRRAMRRTGRLQVFIAIVLLASVGALGAEPAKPRRGSGCAVLH